MQELGITVAVGLLERIHREQTKRVASSPGKSQQLVDDETALEKLMKRLLKSALLTWRPGDGSIKFSSSYECSDPTHVHDPYAPGARAPWDSVGVEDLPART